jgi:hypothetical protein
MLPGCSLIEAHGIDTAEFPMIVWYEFDLNHGETTRLEYLDEILRLTGSVPLDRQLSLAMLLPSKLIKNDPLRAFPTDVEIVA